MTNRTPSETALHGAHTEAESSGLAGLLARVEAATNIDQIAYVGHLVMLALLQSRGGKTVILLSPSTQPWPWWGESFRLGSMRCLGVQRLGTRLRGLEPLSPRSCGRSGKPITPWKLQPPPRPPRRHAQGSDLEGAR